MMASHRPADTPHPPPDPAAPPPEAPPPEPGPTAPTGNITLPASGFLAGFDWVLAFGALAFAFLMASFAARNSDLWMHLAAGRLLASGQYQFGTDPFSYVDPGRVWVNHAWLFDWLLYQVYRLGAGPAVVIAKAIVLALTAGLLLLAGKPGQSVFPGVVCTGLALLAAGPRLVLQPALASFLGVAALMFLILRAPRRPGSWAFPALVAGLFWVWANCDQWFFLGPAFLLLYTLGQYARPDAGEDPGTLWKALGLGVVACMLNPHHVRVWALPPEAFDRRLAEMFAADLEFGPMFRGGLDKEYWDFDVNPVAATALILLLALTVAGFAANRRRASFGLGLVVVGALALAYLHLRAIPFLAFVAAPAAAVNLAALGQRLAERPMPEGTVRTLHALRTAGRGMVGLVGLFLIALTYPGWTHPFNQQRRWKWDVEPSQSLVRAAERIQKWRTDGALPPEARLLNLQPDAANYVAWFAPAERTFFDYRLAFHRPEAAEYANLRQYLRPRDPRERRQDPYDLTALLRKYNVTYAVSAHLYRIWNQAAVDALWGEGPDPAGGPDWVLWHVDGRAVVLGWTRQEAIPPAAFDRLRFDPLRAAFVEAAPLDKPDVRPPLPARDVWERFVQPPPVAPAEAEEAFVLMRYRQSLVGRAVAKHRLLLDGTHLLARDELQTPALTVWTFAARQMIPVAAPPEVNAVAVLAVRAGRRAVATSPDHPEGYYLLAKAYMDSTFYASPDLQETVTTVNLTRARARLPDELTARRPAVDVLDLCDQLNIAHERATPRRLDLRLDATRLAVAYLRDELDFLEGEVGRLTGEHRERLDNELEAKRKVLDTEERRLKDGEADLQKSTNEYLNRTAGSLFLSPLNRAALARAYGLHREATKELRRARDQYQKDLDDKKQFTPDELALLLAVHAELVELLMFDGQVEEAAQILDSLDTPDTRALMQQDGVRRAYLAHRRQALAIVNPQRPFSRFDDDPAAHFRALRQAVAVSIGDFPVAVAAQTDDLRAVTRELAEFKARTFPAGLPQVTGLLDPFDPKLTPFDRALAVQLVLHGGALLAPLNPVAGQVGGLAQAVGVSRHLERAEQFLALAHARVSGHMRLALTCLEQGDVPLAAHHFREALKSPEFKDPLPAQRQAQEYLRAIDRATAGRGSGS